MSSSPAEAEALFYLAAVVLIAAVYGYPAWRLLVLLPLSSGTVPVAAVVVVLAALPLLYLFALPAANAPGRGRRLLAWAVFLDLGTAVVLFDAVLARDLAWLLARSADAVTGHALLGPGPPHLETWRIRSAWASLGLAGLLLARGLYNGRRTPRVHRLDIPVRDLPTDLEGLRIVHLTDLHASPMVRRPFVERVVDAVADLHPHLVVFTGDLADGPVADQGAQVVPLGRLRPPLGAWFSTGNHDYYHDAAGWLALVTHLGFQVVTNDHCTVDVGASRLVIGGLPDPAGAAIHSADGSHAPRVDAVFAGAPAGLRLLLAHQPRLALKAAAPTGAALTLSGHTHGGQLWPWSLLVQRQQGLLAGLHRAPDDGGWIYVSRGLGTWGPPLRLGAPAEVACLTLRRL